MARGVPTLHAEATGGVLRYRLDRPERDVTEPLQEEFRHPIDDHALRALRETAAAILRSPERPGFAAEARRYGAVLYRTLVPPALRTPLKAVAGPLVVSTSLYGLPWELLHDDDEFWGLRYAMGKRLVTSRPLVAAGGGRRRERLRALVIGSDPRRDLPFVRREVDAICAALDPLADLVCVVDDLATIETVTAGIADDFDLIHYCGHVVAGADGPALLLADGVPLSAGLIEANLGGRPVVFVNGCASARGATAALPDGWEEGFSNIAHAFLFGGAIGVVGTLCDVSDRHAATLAERFYAQVFAGTAVGEALREARCHCRESPATADSPSWLGFVLYGNPAHTLVTAAAPGPSASAPGMTTQPRSPRARRLWVPVSAVLLLLAVVLAYRVLRLPPPAVGPLVLGVMQVSPRSAAVPDWMREITRDSLNTILSGVDGVRVYSRQKIDFVRDRRHLSEIEAAETLGITKMLSATVAVQDSSVTLELQVVDTATGLLAGSGSVRGRSDQLIELQNELALRALRALGVTPSADQMKEIASRTNETLDSYRTLRETLGAGRAPAVPAPRSGGPGTSWLAWDGVAWADDGDPQEGAIRALLARWAAALEAKKLDVVKALQPGMTDEQRAALVRYFENARDLQVRISDVDLLIEGDEALATFTRDDRFTDGRTGREIRLRIRINGILGREGGEWTIRDLREPS